MWMKRSRRCLTSKDRSYLPKSSVVAGYGSDISGPAYQNRLLDRVYQYQRDESDQASKGKAVSTKKKGVKKIPLFVIEALLKA